MFLYFSVDYLDRDCMLVVPGRGRSARNAVLLTPAPAIFIKSY
jgi:hypothetical protein